MKSKRNSDSSIIMATSHFLKKYVLQYINIDNLLNFLENLVQFETSDARISEGNLYEMDLKSIRYISCSRI